MFIYKKKTISGDGVLRSDNGVLLERRAEAVRRVWVFGKLSGTHPPPLATAAAVTPRTCSVRAYGPKCIVYYRRVQKCMFFPKYVTGGPNVFFYRPPYVKL